MYKRSHGPENSTFKTAQSTEQRRVKNATTLRYFPRRLRLNQTNQLFLEDIIYYRAFLLI